MIRTILYAVLAMLLPLAVGAIAAMVLVGAPSPARPHEAPSGWTYPLACCSGRDCDEIPARTVRESPDGYHIELTPADHHVLTKPVSFVVPYNDTRVRMAPDGAWHACIQPQGEMDGHPTGGNLICLFVPGKMF